MTSRRADSKNALSSRWSWICESRCRPWMKCRRSSARSGTIVSNARTIMPDQIEQPPQTLARSERRTDRDLQRAALRDLVALASECAKTEAEIEQRHKTEIEESNLKLDKTLFVTEQRGEHLKDQVRQKHHD